MKVNKLKYDQSKELRIDSENIVSILSDAYARFMGKNLKWNPHKHLVIDTDKLRASAEVAGDYGILKCDCGYPECIDLSPIEVSHFEEKGEQYIEWLMYPPMHQGDRSEDRLRFVFHKPQYVRAIAG